MKFDSVIFQKTQDYWEDKIGNSTLLIEATHMEGPFSSLKGAPSDVEIVSEPSKSAELESQLAKSATGILEKHTIDEIQEILKTSTPDLWIWQDGPKEQFIYKQDVMLRVELFTSQRDHEDYEEVRKKVLQQGIPGDKAARDVIKKEYNFLCSWAADFPDLWFHLRTAKVYYGNSLIEQYPVLSCDGGRIEIIAPRPASDPARDQPIELKISPLEYNLSRILTCLGSSQRIWDYEARFPHRQIIVSD